MVGIDIGSKSIKIIELAKSGTSWQLKASGAIGYKGNTPDKMIDDKEIAALADIIKKLAKQVGVTSKDVNMSIPEELVFTRVIKFPYLSEEEINSAVKWEAEQYIPIPIAEAVIQHTVLERNEAQSYVSVLLVAVPKTVVEKYINVVRQAGFIPVSAETELIAMARSLSPTGGVALLIDMGASSSDIAVIKDGNLSFSRSIPVAGDAFTRSISQSLGIAAQQAEEYKKTYGMSASQLEGKVRAALEPVFRMIVDEIKKAIHFYQSDQKGEAPTSIVITGGASNMPDIVPALTESLGVETAFGNPFAKVTLDAEVSKALAPYSSMYGVAVGLAMRED